MQTGYNKELRKLLDIPLTDAGSDPDTVVVMDLDAHLTLGAVETPRRPQNATRPTVG